MSLFSQVLGQDSHFDKHVLQIVGWNHHLKYIYTIALKARKQKHRWVTYESRNTPIFMCKVFQMKDSSSKVWIHLAGSFNQAVDASTSCYLLSLKYQKTSKVIVYQESWSIFWRYHNVLLLVLGPARFGDILWQQIQKCKEPIWAASCGGTFSPF